MMNRQQFEFVVTQAIGELPEYFREKMENISIHIEDLPDQNILKSLGYPSPYSILGFYQGIPATRRGIHYRNVMPDRIFIFRMPILSRNRDKQSIIDAVKRVVKHEIGHYFGLSEQDLFVIENEQSINRHKINKDGKLV